MNAPPIAAAANDVLHLVASLTVGGAIALTVYWVIAVLAADDLAQGLEWRYDVTRINELRRIDPWYRFFQPAIQVFARFNRAVFRDSLPEIQRELQAAGLPRFWLAEEYLGRIELFVLFASPVLAYVLFGWLGPIGLLVLPLMLIALGWLLRRRLSQKANYRLRLIKRRMPYLLDLLTLLMEAGATFLNALRQAVNEFEGHPIAEEFGRVLIDMNLGKTRTEAFQALRDRLADDEITSIVTSILQGESLGTPLGRIFRTQADVLRIKRSQRAETVAGEAGVNMLLPAVLVMASTAIVIIGPFFLNIVRFGLNM